MEEGGMLLSHLLSRKERSSELYGAGVGLLLTALLQQRASSPGQHWELPTPSSCQQPSTKKPALCVHRRVFVSA